MTHLRRMRASFFDRIDDGDLRLGLLDDDTQVREALIAPLLSRGAVVTDNANIFLEKLIDECSRYPYFVQVSGSALWRGLKSRIQAGTDKSVIDEGLIFDALDHLRNGRFRHFSSQTSLFNDNMKFAAYTMSLLLMEDESLTLRELDRSVEVGLRASWNMKGIRVAPEEKEASITQVRTQIVHAGFVWQPDGGIDRFEPGIPSMITHLRDVFEGNRDFRVKQARDEIVRMIRESDPTQPLSQIEGREG